MPQQPGSPIPGDWFVDPVYLGVPGVRQEDEEISWQADALCAQTDPEAFFPEKGGSTREAKRSAKFAPSASSMHLKTTNVSEFGAACPNASAANCASRSRNLQSVKHTTLSARYGEAASLKHGCALLL